MKQRILAVDDDPNNIEILQYLLNKEGYEVLTASDGHEAVRVFGQQMPDLVLMDVMMPGMDGFEACQKIKAIKEDIPIIMLTARGDEVDKVVGFRLGADDYQTKPFNFTELSLRIKAVLRRSGGQKAPVSNIIRCGDIVIDQNRHQLKVRGKTVELTPKEFELLWILAAHPNQVFSKPHLLDKVWDSNYYGDDNTVNVHIRRLREKLEDNPSQPKYIKTVWGVGYKFDYPQA